MYWIILTSMYVPATKTSPAFTNRWYYYFSQNVTFLYYKPNVVARIHLTGFGNMMLESSSIVASVKFSSAGIPADGELQMPTLCDGHQRKTGYMILNKREILKKRPVAKLMFYGNFVKTNISYLVIPGTS